ncbi:indole-3-glycerol phosphate synthase TrpC [Thermodesulfobacteriota bacterium]
MILDTIVGKKRQEVETLLRDNSFAVQKVADELYTPRGFKQALMTHEGVSLIAEVKKASPSKGVIRQDFDPVKIAGKYQEGGAQALSVLTDEHFFQGSLDYLLRVRQAVELPVLRKDFIIHEAQIHQARSCGSDAVLLIVAILEKEQIRDYLAISRELGMDVLVEVHDEQETEIALEAGSDLIGINNRNLKDFSVSMETTFQVMRQIPENIPVVSESGIRGFQDISGLAEAGVAAVLVGETLMRADDQVAALRDLMGW